MPSDSVSLDMWCVCVCVWASGFPRRCRTSRRCAWIFCEINFSRAIPRSSLCRPQPPMLVAECAFIAARRDARTLKCLCLCDVHVCSVVAHTHPGCVPAHRAHHLQHRRTSERYSGDSWARLCDWGAAAITTTTTITTCTGFMGHYICSFVTLAFAYSLCLLLCYAEAYGSAVYTCQTPFEWVLSFIHVSQVRDASSPITSGAREIQSKARVRSCPSHWRGRNSKWKDKLEYDFSIQLRMNLWPPGRD